MASGGTVGQLLAKASNNDYDTEWLTVGGTVTSVGIVPASGMVVSGSPVTASGEIVIAFDAGYQAYTSAEASKLAGIAAGAEVNVNADWSAISGDAQILNKPSIPASLDDLSDVDLATTPPADGEALVYDAANAEWVPGAAVASAAGSANEIQYNDGASGLAASADLTWDGFRLFASAISYFSRRPVLHRGSLFYKTTATALSITAGSVLNGVAYNTATAVTMPGSFTNNTDYAIWQHPTTGALVADASFTTAPAGATGGSIVGGFHYIPSGRPTAVNNGSPTSAAEILEFSLWDLTWRPSSPDPRGMACIEGGFWIDLYLCGATSYAGSTFSAVPSSRIGLTIADGSSPPLVPAQYGGNGSTAYGNGKWYVFTEVARSFGKRLPTYDEFSAAAYGAPEASSRGSDPGTVQWERVSKFGLAQATGTLWQWGQETCTSDPPSGWTSGSETDGRGQVYGSPTRAVILGGAWNFASDSGSRCASWSGAPWASGGGFGARFAAGHLVLA